MKGRLEYYLVVSLLSNRPTTAWSHTGMYSGVHLDIILPSEKSGCLEATKCDFKFDCQFYMVTNYAAMTTMYQSLLPILDLLLIYVVL